MPAKQPQLIPMLSDPGRTECGGLYTCGEKELCCHVVVIGNEGPHANYLHKEVWSLTVKDKMDEVTWDFPGEAPRTVANEGWLGVVAHPWTPETCPAGFAALQEWRQRDADKLRQCPRRLLQRALPHLSDAQVATLQQALGVDTLVHAVLGAEVGVVGGA